MRELECCKITGMSRAHQFDISAVGWSWLFPVAVLVHIIEEYWGGVAFSTSPSEMRGVSLRPAQFLTLTAIGLGLLTVGVVLAHRLKFQQWLMVCLGTIVSINGLTHTASSIFKAEYNPGLISGVLIFIPLGVVTLLGLRRAMRRRRYCAALAAGIAIHGVISLLARGGEIFGR
jgi:uncharacterized protein with HXXEE motif